MKNSDGLSAENELSGEGELILRISDVTNTGGEKVRARLSPRSRVRVAAALEVEGVVRSTTLVNMSATGALLHIDSPPEAGADVVLIRNRLRSPARVIRVEGNRCAIRFHKRIAALSIAAATHPRGRVGRAVS
jgi:hypothetical protein